MDNSIYHCNMNKSSFLDDLSEVSQDSYNARVRMSKTSNAPSSVGYYPTQNVSTLPTNFPANNHMYNYNPYDYNVQNQQGINEQYIPHSDPRGVVHTDIQHHKTYGKTYYDSVPNYNNAYSKYVNYPNRNAAYYRQNTSESIYPSDNMPAVPSSSIPQHYHNTPHYQYFANPTHQIPYYESRHQSMLTNVSNNTNYDETMRHSTSTNMAVVEQQIMNYETRLHHLMAQNSTSKSSNLIMEINDAKEKIVYFKQMREKILNKNVIVNNKIMSTPNHPVKCYDSYNYSNNIDPTSYYSSTINNNHNPEQYPIYSSNNNNIQSNNNQINEQQNPPNKIYSEFNQSSNFTSFVSELIGDNDTSFIQPSFNSTNNDNLVQTTTHSTISNNQSLRDDLSTPPIVELANFSASINSTMASTVSPNKVISNAIVITSQSLSNSIKYPQKTVNSSSISSESIEIKSNPIISKSTPVENMENSKKDLKLKSNLNGIKPISNNVVSINKPIDIKYDLVVNDIIENSISSNENSAQNECIDKSEIKNIDFNYKIDEVIDEVLNSSFKDRVKQTDTLVRENKSVSKDVKTISNCIDPPKIIPEENIENKIDESLNNNKESTETKESVDILEYGTSKMIQKSLPTIEEQIERLQKDLSREDDSLCNFRITKTKVITPIVKCSETKIENQLVEEYFDLSGYSSQEIIKSLHKTLGSRKTPRWLYKLKKMYFNIGIKRVTFKISDKYKQTVLKKRLKTMSRKIQLPKIIPKPKLTKKLIVRSKSTRKKTIDSFLKRKGTRGSYFNNSDNEDSNVNIPRKRLRNTSDQVKLQVITRNRDKKPSTELPRDVDDSRDDSFLDSSSENSNEEIDDDSSSNFELNINNSIKIVQKILGIRMADVSSESNQVENPVEASTQQPSKEMEEFYLKYRGYSYIHCEWKSIDQIADPMFSAKIKRFKNNKANFGEEPDECFFNPDFVEIDRVLDMRKVEIINEEDVKECVIYYLVKWKSLPYEEITWEKAENVDPKKVKVFQQRKSDFYTMNNEVEKPTHSEWTPITTHRVYKNNNKLRDYQLEGVNWLTFCWITNRNCILADEMGLGKTVQSIAFLSELYQYQVKGPFIVIVPLSTLGNWQREFENWSNFHVIVYHGSMKSRHILQNYEIYYRSDDDASCSSSSSINQKKCIFNAIITTYEVLIADLAFFSKIQWSAAIIDEAHRLKNKRCKLFEGLKILKLKFRVLLTGTPLQNNVQELYNLLNFLEPIKFDSESDFLSKFGNLKSEEQILNLKRILKPMMLRRLKEDVEKSLAPKEEIVVEVELTNIQKKYYRAILERNFSFLSKGTSGNNVPNLMNTMMELRKCCNHPFLVKGAEDAILNNLKNGTDMGNIMKFMQNKNADEETLQFYAMVYASGKLVFIHKMLPKLKQNGHKVLIFSQMVRVLDILEDYLIFEKYQYERIDGRIHGYLRQEAIDRFTTDPEKFVFLLCTKAGGLGINLTAADVVIIYDSDWNPQNDLQAQARCHRIGQQKLVNVYRLITRNTYEREMFDRASMKLGLDKAILQSMSYTENKSASQLTKKEIEDLLKLGAYGAIMDDDKDGEKFCEEDIEKILNSRSTIVRLNNAERNSSFSKASFSISDNRSDIKLDDPNFWQKWAKKAGVEDGELCNSLIVDKPRLRRQTNRYKPNCTIFDEISGEDSSNSGNINETPKSKSDYKNTTDITNNNKSFSGYSNNSTKAKSRKLSDPSYTNSQVQSYECTRDLEGEDKVNLERERFDLFRAEKCLLQFGWGRFDHAILKLSFKNLSTEKELETLCRTVLQYAHKYYCGDDRIFSFIEDLIQPDIDYGVMRQHSGYSAPVARGRRGRRGMEEMMSNFAKNRENCNKKVESTNDDNNDEEQSEIFTNISTPLSVNADNIENDPDFSVLICPNFRKHIQRTSHKLLHRIQFLYFLNHEIIGSDRSQLILNDTHHTKINGFPELKLFNFLDNDHLPSWWNTTVDKCLLLGAFKHGWERYEEILKDPVLGFPEWLKGESLPIESNNDIQNVDIDNAKLILSNQDDGDVDNEETVQSNETTKRFEEDFPTNSELNIRLRKIIGGFQKLWRQKEHEKSKCKNSIQNSEYLQSESTSGDYRTCKWSRREETEFYRALNSYGIEKDLKTDEFVWTNLRSMCNLTRKTDESLTEYFKAFYTMCQKICQKLPLVYNYTHSLEIEKISHEKASRSLVRINLISKIRNEIMQHLDLENRIQLCENTNDFPAWWIPGYHDLSLIKGIVKYGATRTELAIINDDTLAFKNTIQKLLNSPPELTENLPTEPPLQSNGKNKNDTDILLESSDVKETCLLKLEEVNKSNDKDTDYLKDQIITSASPVEMLSDDAIEKDPEPPKLAECELNDDVIKGTPEDLKSNELETNKTTKNIIETCIESVSKNTFKELLDDTFDDSSILTIIDKYIDDKMDIKLNCSSILTKIGWPKERALFSRLELIVQTIEKGEWPFSQNQQNVFSTTLSTGGSSTIVKQESIVDSAFDEAVANATQSLYNCNKTNLYLTNNSSVPQCLESSKQSKRRGRKRSNPTNCSGGLPSSVYDTLMSQQQSASSQSSNVDGSMEAAAAVAAALIMGLQQQQQQSINGTVPSNNPLDNPIASAEDELRAAYDAWSAAAVMSALFSSNSLDSNSTSNNNNNNTTASSNNESLAAACLLQKMLQSANLDPSSSNASTNTNIKPLSSNNDLTNIPSTSQIINSNNTGINPTSSSNYWPGNNAPSNLSNNTVAPNTTTNNKSNSNCSVRRGRRPKNPNLYDKISRESSGKSSKSSNAQSFQASHLNQSNSTSNNTNANMLSMMMMNMQSSTNCNTSTSSMQTPSNQDTIIPVINIIDGTLIYDETAPRRKDLHKYLLANPNFMPYSIEEEDQKIFNNVAKTRGQDTSPLYSMLFGQYMNFIMSSMMSIPTTENNNSSSTLPVPNSNKDEQQAMSTYLQYLMMLGNSNASTNNITSNASLCNSAIAPLSTHISTSKNYSISHLAGNNSITTAAASIVAPTTIDPPSALGQSPLDQSQDVMAAYQAYLYSAMMYSDYMSFMQPTTTSTTTSLTTTNSIVPASILPITTSTISTSSIDYSCVQKKQSRVSSFSVESMGITNPVASTQSPDNSSTTNTNNNIESALDLSNH